MEGKQSFWLADFWLADFWLAVFLGSFFWISFCSCSTVLLLWSPISSPFLSDITYWNWGSFRHKSHQTMCFSSWWLQLTTSPPYHTSIRSQMLSTCTSDASLGGWLRGTVGAAIIGLLVQGLSWSAYWRLELWMVLSQIEGVNIFL